MSSQNGTLRLEKHSAHTLNVYSSSPGTSNHFLTFLVLKFSSQYSSFCQIRLTCLLLSNPAGPEAATGCGSGVTVTPTLSTGTSADNGPADEGMTSFPQTGGFIAHCKEGHHLFSGMVKSFGEHGDGALLAAIFTKMSLKARLLSYFLTGLGQPPQRGGTSIVRQHAGADTPNSGRSFGGSGLWNERDEQPGDETGGTSNTGDAPPGPVLPLGCQPLRGKSGPTQIAFCCSRREMAAALILGPLGSPVWPPPGPLAAWTHALQAPPLSPFG